MTEPVFYGAPNCLISFSVSFVESSDERSAIAGLELFKERLGMLRPWWLTCVGELGVGEAPIFILAFHQITVQSRLAVCRSARFGSSATC